MIRPTVRIGRPSEMPGSGLGLSPIAAEMKRLVQDPAYIDAVLADGSDRAQAIASETINAVKDIVGFIRH